MYVAPESKVLAMLANVATASTETTEPIPAMIGDCL